MEPDLSTRALRYALAVADCGNLTQAAAGLHLTQQALSQHIRRLERDLGFSLFDRGPRGMHPSAAGAVWLDGARRSLVGLRYAHDAALDATRADGRTRLRLGYVVGAAGELTGPLLEHLAANLPDVDIELVESPLHDTSAGLSRGAVDAALLRAPMDDRDLDTVELLAEPRVLAAADTHPLAQKPSVHPEDLVDEKVLGFPGPDPVAQAFWSLHDVLGNRGPTVTQAPESLSEELQLVALGLHLSITAQSAARFFPWPGVTFCPLEDCPPSRVIAAVRRDDPRPAPRRLLAATDAFATEPV